jgi:hypothetical protein
MKTKYLLAIALLAGAVIGGAAIQGLHAQTKPPAFVVAEIDVTNQEGFAKEFGPAARKALAIGAGYKALVLGGQDNVDRRSAAEKSHRHQRFR